MIVRVQFENLQSSFIFLTNAKNSLDYFAPKLGSDVRCYAQFYFLFLYYLIILSINQYDFYPKCFTYISIAKLFIFTLLSNS